MNNAMFPGGVRLDRLTPRSKKIKDMNEIKKYLSNKNPDFDEGFRLLSLRLKNKVLLKNIARKRNMSKMLYELKKFIASPVVVNAVPVVFENKLVTYPAIHFSQADLKTAPDVIVGLYTKTLALYADMRGQHSFMRVAQDDESRANHRAEILKLNAEIKEIYMQLDDWKMSGALPLVPRVEDPSNISAKDINSAAAGLTRNLALVKKTPPDTDKYSVYVERCRSNYNILDLVGRKFGENTLSALRQIGIVGDA